MATIFGIDTGAHAVKVAVVEKRFRKIETVKLVRRLKRNQDDTPNVVAEILAENGYDPDEDYIALLYPADRLTWRRIRTPLTKDRLIREALRFEIESVTPFDAEDVVADFSKISSDEKGSDLFTTIALKKDLDPILESFRDAGIEPDALIPAPAIFEDVKVTAKSEIGIVLALDIGYQKTAITITVDGALAGFHSSGSGLREIYMAVGGGDEEKFERLFSDKSLASEEESHSFAVALTTFAKKIATETKNLASTALPEKEWPPEDGVCVIAGGGALSEPLQRSMCDAVGLPLGLIDEDGFTAPIDDDRLSFRNAKPELFTGALIVAQRFAKETDRPLLNFLSGAYGKKRRSSGRGAQVAIAGILMALVAISSLVSYGVETSRLNGRYLTLKEAIRTEFTKALPEVTTIVSEPAQLESALVDLKKNRLLAGSGPGGADPFLERLLDITTARPDGVSLDVDRLVYEGDSVRVSGRTSSFENVEQLKNSFGKLSWTKSVTVSDAKTSATQEGVGFTIIMETSL